jgi:putative NIF3 family GTP cyclohydrolase 1 type 2
LDITPIRSFDNFGLGNVAKLDKKYTLAEFTALLKETFCTSTVRATMDNVQPFDTFAICSGSGATMWKDCLRHGVNVLVTGDLKHHDALDAHAEKICILDIGHFHSEQVYMSFLADVLRAKFDVNVFVADERPPIIDI